MVELHKIKCDKCGSITDLDTRRSVIWPYLPPTEWSNIEGKDLCTVCTKAFKVRKEKIIKEFFK